MKYFLLETDKSNKIPYSINSSRAIDIRNTNRNNAYKVLNGSVVNMKVPTEVFFPSVFTEPLLLVEKNVADTMLMYDPSVVFKTIYLLENESGLYKTYFMPFVEELECLSDKTEKSRGGMALTKIVLKREAAGSKAVFKIAGFDHNYLIGRLDFVESILRREAGGIKFTEIEVV